MAGSILIRTHSCLCGHVFDIFGLRPELGQDKNTREIIAVYRPNICYPSIFTYECWKMRS